MFLTHYGRVGDIPRLGRLLLDLLAQTEALGRRCQQQALTGDARHGALQQGLLAIYRSSLHDHGCTLDAAQVAALLAMDVELNAQGMAVWLDRDPLPQQGAAAAH